MSTSHIVCANDGSGTSGTVLASTINTLIDNPSNATRANTVTLLGDSFSENQRMTNLGNNYEDSVIQSSCWSFLIANLGDKINVNTYAGVIDDQFSDILTRLQTDVLDVGDDWVFLQGGVEDFYVNGRTATAVFDDVKSIVDQIIANGQKVLLLNCYAQRTTRSFYSFSKTLHLVDYNKLIAEYARTKTGVVFVDVFTPSADQSDDTNGGARASYFIGFNDINLTMFGAWDTGRLCEEALAPYMVRSTNTNDMSPLRGGTAIPSVNLSNFNGNAGFAGLGMSGQVPNNWVISRVSGEGALVGSTNAAGYYELAITKSVAGTSSVYRMRTTELKSNFSGGENVESKLIMSIDSALDLEEVRVYWYNDNGVAPFRTIEWGRSFNSFTPISPMPLEDIVINIAPSLVLATPLVNVYFNIDIRMKGATTGIVTLKHLRVDNV